MRKFIAYIVQGASKMILSAIENLNTVNTKKEDRKMIKLFDAFVIVVSLTLVLGWMLPSAASAEGGTCYLKADRDVYLKVYNFDNHGNRGGILWQGRLNKGKIIILNSPNGLFSYEYNDQPDEDQPFESSEQRMCNSNETIGVP